MKLSAITTALAGMLISGMLSHAVIAQEDPEDTTTDTDTSTESTQWSDESMLIETLLKDDEAAITEAKDDISDAEQALEDAGTALSEAESDPDITDEELTELEQTVADAEEQLSQVEKDLAAAEDSLTEEEELVTEQVEGELTDEQVADLNRSLNNANASGLVVDLDSDDLQAAIDGEYNRQQINMLTKSAEAEAKFDDLAGMFEERADETGNDKFLEHSERMANKADTERGKFQNKIDKFDSLKDKSAQAAAKNEAKRSAKAEAKLAAKENSKEMAKGLAKKAAKDTAKQAAKENAKENAKQNAKENAKENVKQIVKEEGKRAAKSQGQGPGNNSAN